MFNISSHATNHMQTLLLVCVCVCVRMVGLLTQGDLLDIICFPAVFCFASSVLLCSLPGVGFLPSSALPLGNLDQGKISMNQSQTATQALLQLSDPDDGGSPDHGGCDRRGAHCRL